MGDLRCPLHGREYLGFCNDCKVMLCPCCTEHERHRTTSFQQIKGFSDENQSDLLATQVAVSRKLEPFRRQLESLERDKESLQEACEVMGQRQAKLDQEAEEDRRLLSTLLETLRGLADRAQSRVMVDVASEDRFDQDLARERSDALFDHDSLRARLANAQSAYIRAYQRVTVAETLLAMKD